MSLRDIMSAAGLTTWPQIALVLFFVAFCAIIVYLFVVRRNRPYDHEASLPLDDDAGPPPRQPDTNPPAPENGHA